MESLSKKIQNLGIHDIRNAARFAQNVIVQYEPYQIDIRRASNTDSWGPTPKHLEKVMRNRYQVPLYLITEYTLKRLIDHIATRPKNLYEKARKQYVNYGSEWRVVLKCLIVLEYLLLNVEDGDELNQVRSCLVTHKHILTKQVPQYKINFSNDGKMEVHERGIKKKAERIVQLLEDKRLLKKERDANRKNTLKIRQQLSGTLHAVSYNANDMDTMATSTASPTMDSTSYSGGRSSFETNEFYGTGDEEFGDGGSGGGSGLDDGDIDENDAVYQYQITDPSIPNVYNSSFTDPAANAIYANSPQRKKSSLEEQRRQRREILRERIKNTEQQRKNRLKQQRAKEEEVPDLIDFDFDTTAATPTTTTNNNNNNNDDDDDDDFGDFQSETTPKTTAPSGSASAAPGTLNDLLNLGSSTTNKNSTTTTNNNATSSNAGKDLFADLYNNSKSLI